MMTIKWASAPTEDDIDDATKYLSLLGDPPTNWSTGTNVMHYAKDLIRASRLAVLPKDNAGVKKYLDRIKKGETISPVLVIAGDLDLPVTIAEGYHRICACYILDEKTLVACRISV